MRLCFVTALASLAILACSPSPAVDAGIADSGDSSALVDAGIADSGDSSPPSDARVADSGGAIACVPLGDGAPEGQLVTVGAELGNVSPAMIGVNVNKWFNGALGLWDVANDEPSAEIVAKVIRARVGLLRFPGGTSANLMRWKRLAGPHAERRCQIDALTYGPRLERDYGPAAFGAVLAATGAEGQIMVPFAVVGPSEAADLVEYMNAPVGTNPNGGIAWAEVRAADGWPNPIGITRWELGNEHDRGNEGYWMAQNKGDLTAMKARRLTQYIDGDEFEVTDQPLARECDVAQSASDGTPGQVFYLRWGRIKNGTSPVVKVGTSTWTRVANLSAASPTDQVYELDRDDARVTFGDGLHGAIPPAKQQVRVSYTFRHAGFIPIYEAMKATAEAIGTPIDVCSTWAPVDRRGTAYAELGEPSFVDAMSDRGSSAYDCVVDDHSRRP